MMGWLEVPDNMLSDGFSSHFMGHHSPGNGAIRHVETCPDFFFSLQEYTQQNPLSKF
jgi:hypothetical protein